MESIKKVKKYIFFQIIFDLVGVCCLAITPLLQKYFFDHALSKGFDLVLKIAVLYFLLYLIYVISQYYCMIFAFKGGVQFEKSLKKNFFNSLFLRKDYEFRRKEIGDYISFQANDITALEQDYLQPFIDIIKSVNMFLVYSLVLFVGIDWRIAIIIISSSFLSIIIPKVLGKKLKHSREVYQKQLAHYVVRITDILGGFRLINHQTIENIETVHEQELTEAMDKRYSFGKNKIFTLVMSLFFTKMVKVISFIAIIILFYQKQITIGTGIATLSFVSVLIDPIDSILYDITTIQSVKKIKEEYTDFVSYVPEVKEKIEVFHKDIKLRNISYHYEDFTLKNINLTFLKGNKYLITGDSGSGKSTLLKIIAGYLKSSSGFVEMDGKKINDYDYQSLISYIEQEDHIFNENILNNITVYGSYHYNHKKYENISTRINHIYQSDIENVQQMSGGEKQVISLLRTFAKNSDILLMDEPFSAIDYRLHQTIMKYLEADSEFKDKMMVIISHHIDDQILECFDYHIHMENGEVKRVDKI